MEGGQRDTEREEVDAIHPQVKSMVQLVQIYIKDSGPQNSANSYCQLPPSPPLEKLQCSNGWTYVSMWVVIMQI